MNLRSRVVKLETQKSADETVFVVAAVPSGFDGDGRHSEITSEEWARKYCEEAPAEEPHSRRRTPHIMKAQTQ